MPQNVYTAVLFANPSLPSGITSSNAVPAGFVWVVRNISVATPGQPYSNDGGWAVLDDERQIIFGKGFGATSGATIFYWEGRQLVDTGHTLLFNGASSGGYNLRITGYVLSLP